jgi:hypothetical protein
VLSFWSNNGATLFNITDKVTNVETDVDKKTVIVTSTLSVEELQQTLEKTGKEIKYVGLKKYVAIIFICETSKKFIKF